jgi:diguanylate cyclase (GGDEF)-like protein
MLALSLEKMHLKLHRAINGVEAMKLINNKENNFALVITDYHMPEMDGLELTQEIRKLYKKDEIAVIALSAQDDSESTSLFLKVGANDFVKKPFSYDELALRMNLNLEMLDLFNQNKTLATKDSITPLHNRRFFEDSGEALLLKAQRDKKNVLAVVLSINNFTKLQQEYSHTVAERVLIESAIVLQESVRRSDLLARHEDAEFTILFDHISREDGENIFAKIHQNFSELTIDISPTQQLSVSISIGAIFHNEDNLDHLLGQAKKAMLVAQSSGKAKTIFFD